MSEISTDAISSEGSTTSTPSHSREAPKKTRKARATHLSAPTRLELDSISSRISDARCAIELASHAACSGDEDTQSKVPGVLDMVIREIRWIEEMLDPVTIERLRAQRDAQ